MRKTVRIAVCEDNDNDILMLRKLICSAENAELSVTEYRSANELLRDIESGRRRFDLILLNISEGEKNGVEAARMIRAQDDNVMLIFLSRSEAFYKEAFAVYAFQYLIKPLDTAFAAEAIKKAIGRTDRLTDEILEITYKGRIRVLKYSDITYISSSNHNLRYHMRDGSEYISRGKLDELSLRINSGLFVRCHKSFMVNLACVRELTADGFCTENELIPISRTYSAAARENYRKFISGIQ